MKRYKIGIKIFDKKNLVYVKFDTLVREVIRSFFIMLFFVVSIMICDHIEKRNKIISDLINENNELKQKNIELTYERDINNLHALTGKFVINKKTDSPSIDTLASFLNECGAWYPDIIIAQAILESGTFTSNIYNETYNMFGMRKPKIRETTSLNTYSNNFANYYNWQLSAIDRIHWDLSIFKNNKPTRDEYLKKLQNIYAEEPTYLQRIDSIIKCNNL